MALLLCLWRLARGQEERARVGERFGCAGLPRPEGRLIWLHGASIGEVSGLLPLARRLLQGDAHLQVLITSTTRASSLILAQRMPPRCCHQYAPYDYPGAVRRFLRHWQPDLAVWTESELWPQLILATRARNIPMAQVSAWISERSWRRWRRVPRTASALLNCFSLCMARDQATAGRLRDLRGRACDAVANLKEAAPDLPCDGDELAALRDCIQGRPCWLAANSHAGEEALLARAHAELRRRHPRMLLLLAPRRPERARALVRALEPAAGLVRLRSEGSLPAPDTGIYVIDSFGELGLFYRAVPLVFLGGSLVARRGHNPLEPARLNCLVLHGRHVAAYSALFAALDAAGGGRAIEGEEALVQAVDGLVRQPRLLQAGGAAAGRFARARGDGMVDEAVRRLLALMNRGLEAGGGASGRDRTPEKR